MQVESVFWLHAGDDNRLVVRQIVEKDDFKAFEFRLSGDWAKPAPIKAMRAKAQSFGGD